MEGKPLAQKCSQNESAEKSCLPNKQRRTTKNILGSPSKSPEYRITLARFFAGEGTASAPGVRVLVREGGQGVRLPAPGPSSPLLVQGEVGAYLAPRGRRRERFNA